MDKIEILDIDKFPDEKTYDVKWKNLKNIIYISTIDITWSSSIINIKENNVCKIAKSYKVIKFIKNEINILKTINNKNIIKFYQIIEYKNKIVGFIMENGGVSLRQLIMNKNNISNCWIENIVNGLSYLRCLNITHSDIRPENILISDKNAKIIDFGCSTTINNNIRENLDPVIEYTPPEYFINKKINHKFDIFSLGVCIWESISYVLPYNDLSQEEIKYKIINFDFDLIPENTDTFINNVINICRRSYDKRPNADELIKIIIKKNLLF